MFDLAGLLQTHEVGKSFVLDHVPLFVDESELYVVNLKEDFLKGFNFTVCLFFLGCLGKGVLPFIQRQAIRHINLIQLERAGKSLQQAIVLIVTHPPTWLTAV